MSIADFLAKKKGKVIIIIVIAALILAGGATLGYFLWKQKYNCIPNNFSADIDDQIEFYVTINWEDIDGAQKYNIEYEYYLYPGVIHSKSVTISEATIYRKRGELKYRVQSVVNGKASPFSAWQSYFVPSMEIPFSVDPTLKPDEEKANTYILTLPFIAYKKYGNEYDLVTTFEVQEKLPSDTAFRQSIYKVTTHVYVVPEDEQGIFTVRVRVLNNTKFPSKDEITGESIIVTENLPVELYDLYEPSDWVEVSIELA